MHFQQCASKREPFKAAGHPVADGISDLERRGIEIELEGTILSFHALHHAYPLLRYYRKAAPGFNTVSPSSLRIDRQSVVEGKSVSVRVDLGGRRIIKKKKEINQESKKKRK